MEKKRQEKIARLIQKELSDIFQRDRKHLYPKQMISVTVVRVTPDLSIAKVYLSIFPSREPQKIIDEITLQTKAIRNELGQRVKNQLRKIPELQFYLDDSLDYSERIDELLNE